MPPPPHAPAASSARVTRATRATRATEERAPTKGERTATRILDASEALFAERGFEGTSLRAIAARAGLQEPGIYNHFAGKQALYEAVLERALRPMLEVLRKTQSREGGETLPAPARPAVGRTLPAVHTTLPAVMTDLLAEHPRVAALFSQALQGDRSSPGNQLMTRWLDELFDEGLRTSGTSPADAGEHALQVLRVIAVFNLTTGYFLSERVLENLGGGALLAPDNLERQKRLLERMVRAAFEPDE